MFSDETSKKIQQLAGFQNMTPYQLMLEAVDTMYEAYNYNGGK